MLGKPTTVSRSGFFLPCKEFAYKPNSLSWAMIPDALYSLRNYQRVIRLSQKNFNRGIWVHGGSLPSVIVAAGFTGKCILKIVPRPGSLDTSILPL